MSPYEVLIRAVPIARRSPMIADLEVSHPWRKLGGFVALGMLFVVLSGIAVAIPMFLMPGTAALLEMTDPLSDTPMRLADESQFTLLMAASLGAMALAILAAAAVAYRVRAADFLWPGRRFNVWDLGVGFLAMVCVSTILLPVYFWLGDAWTPPVLNPLYVGWTVPLFILTSVIGLLIAAAAEEVVCRGVLLRLTTQLTRHPVALCLINGVVFSALHLDPDPVAFVARALSGAIWTWAAIRLGGLEFAVGAHLANNLVIILLMEPMSAMLETGRSSQWVQLAPEVFTTVIMLIVVERLADGPRDWRPAGSASRGSA